MSLRVRSRSLFVALALALALAAGRVGAVASAPGTSIAELVERSTAIAIGEVTASTPVADGAFVRHTLAVAEMLRGAARPQLSVVEESLSSVRLFEPGQRVLVFLRPAPSYSLLRKALPGGEHFAPIERRAGIIPLAPESDAAARQIVAGFASEAADRAALVRLELRSGNARFVADAAHLIGSGAGLTSELSDEDLAALRAGLDDARVDPAARAELVRVLGERGFAQIVPLLEALDTTDGALLAARARALARLGMAPDAQETLRLLAHRDPALRSFAVEQLERSGGEDLVPRLEKVALRDPAPRVRVRAVEALARQRKPGAVSALRKAFDSDDARVRRAAARAFYERRGDPEVAKALSDLALMGGSYEVQARAVFLLFANGAKREDAVIQAIARDHPDPRIRTLIEKGIEGDPHIRAR